MFGELPYCFLNLAKLFELGTKGTVICVPRKATASGSAFTSHMIQPCQTYPMNNLDIVGWRFAQLLRTTQISIHNSHTARVLVDWTWRNGTWNWHGNIDVIHDRRTGARMMMIGQIKVSRGGRAANEHLKVGFRGRVSISVERNQQKLELFRSKKYWSLQDAIRSGIWRRKSNRSKVGFAFGVGGGYEKLEGGKVGAVGRGGKSAESGPNCPAFFFHFHARPIHAPRVSPGISFFPFPFAHVAATFIGHFTNLFSCWAIRAVTFTFTSKLSVSLHKGNRGRIGTVESVSSSTTIISNQKREWRSGGEQKRWRRIAIHGMSPTYEPSTFEGKEEGVWD